MESDLDNDYLNTADSLDTGANNEREIITEENDQEITSESNQLTATESSNQVTATESSNQETLEAKTNSNTGDGSKVNRVGSKINVINTSVVKERQLILRLVDLQNKNIAGKKIKIHVARKDYTLVTDKYGKACLKIRLNPRKYTVIVRFAGDENYTKSNRTFIMKVYKIKTNFTVPYTSIIRGHNFYAYLKDNDSHPLASRYVNIKYRGNTYSKKTDKNGRVQLKINSKIGKYGINLIYNGSESYLKATKKLTIKSYNATTKIVFNSKSIVRAKYLMIYLKHDKTKIRNKKLIINFANKIYKKTTDKNGKVKLNLTKPVGTYKINIHFNGAKGFMKSSRSTKIQILPNYTAIFVAKSKTYHRYENKTIRYYIRLKDLKGNPVAGETVTLKVRCNNFTVGTGKKITKKTIVLSSDGIINKEVDKKRLNDMAKLLRAKGYTVIVYGIGPNYHVNSVQKYKNVCVFHLVGGIDSGMYVDMASNYYQSYLKKNKNQFVLGCVYPSTSVNLANRTWLDRAHDDNYSPKSFTGMYFPGKYLNKKVHIDYVYGSTPKELVDNFWKYGKNGKSIGMYNILPNHYKTYTRKTNKNGYVYLDLPIGNRTVISSFINKNKGTSADSLTTWVNVIK